MGQTSSQVEDPNGNLANPNGLSSPQLHAPQSDDADHASRATFSRDMLEATKALGAGESNRPEFPHPRKHQHPHTSSKHEPSSTQRSSKKPKKGSCHDEEVDDGDLAKLSRNRITKDTNAIQAPTQVSSLQSNKRVLDTPELARRRANESDIVNGQQQDAQRKKDGRFMQTPTKVTEGVTAASSAKSGSDKRNKKRRHTDELDGHAPTPRVGSLNKDGDGSWLVPSSEPMSKRARKDQAIALEGDAIRKEVLPNLQSGRIRAHEPSTVPAHELSRIGKHQSGGSRRDSRAHDGDKRTDKRKQVNDTNASNEATTHQTYRYSSIAQTPTQATTDRPTTKKSRSVRKPVRPKADSTPTASDRETATPVNSGMFSQEEKAMADQIFEESRQEEGLSVNEMKAKIQDWRNAGIFKLEILRAFPNRPVRGVRRFCLRRYHNLDRGAWTAEQDEALRSAYQEMPDQWAKISALVGRTDQDCRDRWRDHVKLGNQKESGPWSQQEEEALTRIVDESIAKIKHEYRRDPDILRDLDGIVSMVSWSLVSRELGHNRSAKRCREKYAKLQQRERRLETTQSMIESPLHRPTMGQSTGNADSARRRRAIENLQSFELGDYYDVFVEIHTAFSDHSKRFNDEDQVVWAMVSLKNPDSRFSKDHMQGMLRRVAFEEAIAKWASSSAKIKKELSKASSIAAKALILAKWIESEDPDGTRPRSYWPEKMSRRKSAKQDLSERFVVDSDDEATSTRPEKKEEVVSKRRQAARTLMLNQRLMTKRGPSSVTSDTDSQRSPLSSDEATESDR